MNETTERQFKGTDEKFCTDCGKAIKANAEICPKCGIRQSTIPNKKTPNKLWYETGWVWFWLILVWPVGIFGLIKRAKPQHQKWWWGGIAVLFLIALFDEQSNDNKVNKGTFTDQQICIATIAKIMGRDPLIIKIDALKGNVTYLSYNRPSDGSRWANRCKLEGNKVIWASETGRWRTDPNDSKITFSISGDKIDISEEYLGGSVGVETYSINQLGG